MGNKIITEKDFWKCDTGAVPAQFQSTQKTVKKLSGEKYITVRDTSTSSWIDFGCTRLMLIYAIIAAAVVVIAAMTVATGGAALIALGALAGLAGAAWGAIVGTLLCGQIAAKARKWVGSKKDYIVQGVKTITGDHIMTCPVGGTIKFAPEIKSWSQAVALGFANYTGKLMEGMMAGAAIGMAGAAVAGGAGAFTSGGMRGIGQAAWQFAKSMPKNFVVNAIESVGAFGLSLRGVMGLQNVAATYGNTGQASEADFWKGTVAMETGAWDSANLIYSDATGGVVLDENGNQKHASWQDYVGMAMMFAPVGQGKRDLENKLKNEPDGSVRDSERRADDAEANKGDDENSTRAEVQDVEGPRQEGEYGAFEGDPISQSQRNEIAGVEDGTIPLEGYEGHKRGNHTRKGNYGEMKMDQHFEGINDINGQPAELTPLHERISNIDETGHQGIDGVYENASPPPQYIIAESKYGSSDLSKNTKDGPQMGDNWILGGDRLENAVGTDKADDIRFELENNPGNVQRVLTKVDANGNVTTYTIDSSGNVTGPWP
ncbi:hypothetical protein SAMN05421768_10636 [Chryseobacterium joostei]|uniref:DUF4280 domain-containing protein n=1 Tax=Chryseobacterium joostei TaxID=112234 RepID=A0A1N7ILK5_9FLAO|nr:hypothetical protein [Chryseobacterium joostei]SIS37955.1 hypothetical protein SAMN05421768_10636 [Chryseobacterium joostei]